MKKPIQKSADIVKLQNSDLTKTHSNVFKYFETKTTNDFEKVNKSIIRILRTIPAFKEFLEKNRTKYKKFEVVFPKGVLEKIKSGKYLLNKKKGTDKYLAFVKDAKTNSIVKQILIKDVSSLEKIKNLQPSLQQIAIMSALNQLSMQLEEIEEKLIDIHKEFNNDRIGKIQAGYSTYLDALQMSDKINKKQSFISALSLLNEGRSQLIESAKQRISNIKVGFLNSLLQELTSIDFEKKQKNNIKEFIKEVFYIQRTTQIILTIYQEMKETKSSIQSLVPFKDFMNHINEANRADTINEWETSNTDWKKLSKLTLKAIEKITDTKNNDIKIKIENYE